MVMGVMDTNKSNDIANRKTDGDGDDINKIDDYDC